MPMTLPVSCEKCAPYAGAWMETPKGLRRCDCARGKALELAAQPQPARDPVISPAAASMCAEMMAGIPFFPGEAGARSAIANEIAAMCHSDQQAAWLATRMNRLYRRWPGINEMRMVFWAKDRPLDGVEARGISEAYPEGIPSERAELPALPAAAPRQIEAGAVSKSPSISSTLADLVRAKDLNRKLANVPPPTVREIPVINITDANRITLEDIQREEKRIRKEKSKVEAGIV